MKDQETSVHERVRTILCGLIDGSIDAVVGCRELSALHNAGHTWIPAIFVGLHSEFDSLVPPPETHHLWNQAALARMLANPAVQAYRKEAQAEARRLLDELFPDSACS